MRYVSIFAVVVSMLLTVACNEVPVGGHAGKKAVVINDLELDSLIIDADSTSIRGHLDLMDTSLIFVDYLYCKLFPYSIYTGKPGEPWGGRGNGPNEMVGVMAGSALHPADTSMWIINADLGVYDFSPKTGKIDFMSRMDFSWDKLDRNNYDSPSVYLFMEMTNFGSAITDIGNNEVIIPITLVNRFLDDVSIERYNKGHIFGLMDKSTLEVKKVFGSMPEYYKEHPLPLFEFFDYAMDHNDSILYVNHTPDSLIYCYRYPDELLYTIGFEPEGMHRDFDFGYDYKFDEFRNEIRRVSVNTGLYYDPVDKVLFRTSMTDYESGNSVLQIYHDKDLIGEVKVPPFFKVLGRVGDRYYAVRMDAVETDDEEVYFILYSFDKLDL